jgi:ABC-2 type transport system ATP-binding protein
MDAAIDVSKVNKRYGDLIAVEDLSLCIEPGEIYGFLGLNGAGKTTTIRMLLGMIRPNTGSVSLFGTKVQPGQRMIWERVGYMVETPHSYPDLTVRQNLEIVQRLRKLSNDDAVDRVIEQLSLTRDADRRAKALSHGNYQRLGLAKALIHHPDLLILDEPANGLDPAGIVEIRNLLHSLAENDGVTVFMSSHILSEVNRLATRIGVVHQGRLVKEFDSTELAEQEQQRLLVNVKDTANALTMLENAGIPVKTDDKNAITITDIKTIQHPDEVATLLVRAGYPPTRLVVEQGDLESYFLTLVGMKEEKK